jgi:hypothetical protein
MADSFFISFSMIGFALLFLTSKPVTLGSTVMAVGVSLALSNVFGDQQLPFKETLLTACGADVDETSRVSAKAVAQLCAYRVMRMTPFGDQLE